MTVCVIPGPAYHRGMDDGLPHPAESLTLGEIAERPGRVVELLDRGGAVLVYTDDRHVLLGALTREKPLLDEAVMAAMIDAGSVPPLAELLAADDRGELP